MPPDAPVIPNPRPCSRRLGRTLGIGLSLVALALAAGAGASRPQAGAATPSPHRSEMLLPRFQGPLLAGGISGSDAIGRRRALIWAFSARDPHREAHAGILARLGPDARNANVALLGIARDRDPAPIHPFVRKHGLEFPIVLDPDGAISRRLRLPAGDSVLLVVDSAGYIIGGFVGLSGEAPNLDELYENELRRLLSLEKPDRPARIAFGLRPRAPAFRLTSLSGDVLDSATLDDHVIALVFFLPTCPHCHEALKFLQKFEAELANPAFRVLPASVRDARYVIESMAREQGLHLPMYVDPDRSAQKAYAHSGTVPDIVIIDRSGTVIARHQGSDARIQTLITMEVREALGLENPLLLSKRGYSGEEACRICHRAEHETWSLTRHAYAFESLLEHGEERNPECVECHVVGWNRPGGYSLAEPAAHLEGVQCESCHGRGGPHQSDDPVEGDLEAVCVQCHNAKHSLNFAFADRLPLVSHEDNAELTSLPLDERQRLLSQRNVRKRALFPAGTYVGSESCRECHEQEYELWFKSGHARSFDSLTSKGDHEKPECVSCHVTGYEQKGGYPAGGASMAVVGCESCHGPGAKHVAEGAERKGDILSLADKCDSCVVLQICGSCHDDEWSPNFEFEIQAQIEQLRHGAQPVARAREP